MEKRNLLDKNKGVCHLQSKNSTAVWVVCSYRGMLQDMIQTYILVENFCQLFVQTYVKNQSYVPIVCHNQPSVPVVSQPHTEPNFCASC